MFKYSGYQITLYFVLLLAKTLTLFLFFHFQSLPISSHWRLVVFNQLCLKFPLEQVYVFKQIRTSQLFCSLAAVCLTLVFLGLVTSIVSWFFRLCCITNPLHCCALLHHSAPHCPKHCSLFWRVAFEAFQHSPAAVSYCSDVFSVPCWYIYF